MASDSLEIPDDPGFEDWVISAAIADGVLLSANSMAARKARKAARAGRRWARQKYGDSGAPQGDLETFVAGAREELEPIVGSALGLIGGFLLKQLAAWLIRRLAFWAWARVSMMFRRDPSVLIAPAG